MALKWPDAVENWLEYFCKTYPEWETHEEMMKVREFLRTYKAKVAMEESNSERNSDTQLSEADKKLRMEARDFELRFVGHCNTTTDIKEANFLGKLNSSIMHKY